MVAGQSLDSCVRRLGSSGWWTISTPLDRGGDGLGSRRLSSMHPDLWVVFLQLDSARLRLDSARLRLDLGSRSHG